MSSVFNINDAIDRPIVNGLSVFNVLQQVYGAKGIPFPQKPKQGRPSMIAGKYDVQFPNEVLIGDNGTIKEYTDTVLGKYEFLPCTINGYLIPNSIVLISGEKLLIETDVIESGTVFEKVFIRPYDITIISTLIGYDGNWPEQDFETMANLFKEQDLTTLKCISTNMFLQPKDNFLIKKIDVLDSRGTENVEVIQFSGSSNIDFELEIL
ncbi:MAG: hypothetical protein C0459_03435 [Chitinophaga sp.]|jgi:Domain of unknown function (DUF6046)|nr:hypothetical protein [Chitinophaga sp.]